MHEDVAGLATNGIVLFLAFGAVAALMQLGVGFSGAITDPTHAGVRASAVHIRQGTPAPVRGSVVDPHESPPARTDALAAGASFLRGLFADVPANIASLSREIGDLALRDLEKEASRLAVGNHLRAAQMDDLADSVVGVQPEAWRGASFHAVDDNLHVASVSIDEGHWFRAVLMRRDVDDWAMGWLFERRLEVDQDGRLRPWSTMLATPPRQGEKGPVTFWAAATTEAVDLSDRSSFADLLTRKDADGATNWVLVRSMGEAEDSTWNAVTHVVHTDRGEQRFERARVAQNDDGTEELVSIQGSGEPVEFFHQHGEGRITIRQRTEGVPPPISHLLYRTRRGLVPLAIDALQDGESVSVRF